MDNGIAPMKIPKIKRINIKKKTPKATSKKSLNELNALYKFFNSKNTTIRGIMKKIAMIKKPNTLKDTKYSITKHNNIPMKQIYFSSFTINYFNS